jgi:hypothetical protein
LDIQEPFKREKERTHAIDEFKKKKKHSGLSFEKSVFPAFPL